MDFRCSANRSGTLAVSQGTVPAQVEYGMNKRSRYVGSRCQRCGSAYALRPGVERDELYCSICGAAYYLVPVQPPTPAGASAGAGGLDRMKILLVDDEPGVIDLMSATLEGNPQYELICAADGAEAVRLARQLKPAVVLMDVMMPVMTGLEACKALKVDPATSSIAVILLTARTSSADIARGIEAGADDYVVKPFSPSYLLERIEGWLAAASA